MLFERFEHMAKNSFTDRLKALRKAARYSGQAMAKVLGVSGGWYASVERGERPALNPERVSQVLDLVNERTPVERWRLHWLAMEARGSLVLPRLVDEQERSMLRDLVARFWDKGVLPADPELHLWGPTPRQDKEAEEAIRDLVPPQPHSGDDFSQEG